MLTHLITSPQGPEVEVQSQLKPRRTVHPAPAGALRKVSPLPVPCSHPTTHCPRTRCVHLHNPFLSSPLAGLLRGACLDPPADLANPDPFSPDRSHLWCCLHPAAWHTEGSAQRGNEVQVTQMLTGRKGKAPGEVQGVIKGLSSQAQSKGFCFPNPKRWTQHPEQTTRATELSSCLPAAPKVPPHVPIGGR